MLLVVIRLRRAIVGALAGVAAICDTLVHKGLKVALLGNVSSASEIEGEEDVRPVDTWLSP